ncbi:protein of unknown function (plasmid) [Thiomonas sp. Bio17B3]|uniref:Uncharacterized protein n=1 Tax=Thiomonas delicata TaxID=364030 RepID=A0A238D6Z5_THIDL|nr:hypothetical protein [Thiomonas delicata]VDY06782.1 protein of unknown function [Thiomonas sp. Bio17B3]VDY09921.1 protein of unknown function [Thiomonas sp. Sup16B3]VDY15057.1 protein of unknown function [Thiomonas sp. OC7]VDY15769.1 protein of unknown function [Thiomonas sp. CB2]SBP89077.1 hypothetical protein THIARS_70697 [Thiomonas delicata]
MMHVTKMIVVRRDYRGQPLVVMVRNGRPWFDLKAVCLAFAGRSGIGAADVGQQAGTGLRRGGGHGGQVAIL